MKDTTISLKIDRVLKAKVVSLARMENRSLSNYIEKVLKQEVAKHESMQPRAKVQP
jgi:predicted transcriptional regulator